jgi:DNA-binding MarR family transcriptional regulator
MEKARRSSLMQGDVGRLFMLLRDIGRLKSLRDPLAGSFSEDLGLTPPQCHALLWIKDEASMPMGVLARRLGVTEKTVTGLVDRLEEAGVVRRGRDEDDRRLVTVGLTAQGETLAGRCIELVHAKTTWLMNLLDGEDRAALFRILEKVRDRLDVQQHARAASEAR